MNISRASFARSLPSSAAADRSRKSLLMPETPKTPDFLFIRLSTSFADIFSFSIRKVTTAGSIEPVLVPITTPSSGVKPMDVSTHLPPSTAVTDEPLPR